MKITLLSIDAEKKQCANKDVSGNFGTVTRIGKSIPAKLIELSKKRGVNLPILSLAYAAAILSKNGHDVSFLQDKISKDSDLIIIHSSMIDYKHEIEIAKKIKKTTNSKVGFMGPFSSVKSDLFLPYCDFVICGEPEAALINLKETIPKGKIISEPIKNLDSLPFPLWDIFPYEKYSYSPVINKKPFLVMQSSRGCTYSCSFYCPYTATQGTVWRARDPDKIIEELKYLKRKFKIKGFLFRDPVFSLDKERAKEIAEKIIENNLDIEWACETRLDLLDENLLDTFYKSGLRAINVGIESENEEILKKSKRKSINKTHQEKIIDYCDKIGIKVSAFYILGLEDDTEKSILDTINYAKKLNTHIAQFAINTPIPGTGFYENMKDRFLTNDYEKFDNYTLVFRHKNLTPEQIERLKEKAFVSYYFRPKWFLSYMKRRLAN